MLEVKELIKKLREFLDKEYKEIHENRLNLEGDLLYPFTISTTTSMELLIAISKLKGKEEGINSALCELTYLERHSGIELTKLAEKGENLK